MQIMWKTVMTDINFHYCYRSYRSYRNYFYNCFIFFLARPIRYFRVDGTNTLTFFCYRVIFYDKCMSFIVVFSRMIILNYMSYVE